MNQAVSPRAPMPTAIPPRRLLAIAVAAALAAGCVAAVNTPAPNVGQPEQASPNSFRG